MKRLILGIAALWLSFAATVHAGQTVVVELFTSQGCSSCPPADKIFLDLVERDDIVALSYHVDYWDYLGWKDDFAAPAFTNHQRAYAHAAGERTIYTPQIVVAGQDLLIGSRPMKIANSIRTHAARQQVVDVAVTRSGGKVAIRAKASKRLPKDAVVRLITYIPNAKVKIRRGENAGRTITYANIVRTMDTLGSWNGRSEFRASAKVAKDVPFVVLVQAKGAGPILGATQLR